LTALSLQGGPDEPTSSGTTTRASSDKKAPPWDGAFVSERVDGLGLFRDALDRHAFATRPDKSSRDHIPVEIENPYSADHCE
jgi:hypothetical protein